jgi:hypothetical protein
MKLNAPLTIARYTLLEAAHNRFGALLALVVLCGFLGAQFVGELAITESRQVQAALLGVFLRLVLVFVVGLFVITSISREFNDKIVELMFSLPLPRAGYYTGKLMGYGAVAVLAALPALLLVLLFTEPAGALLWGLSLALELMLAVAVALLFAFAFTQVTLAFTAFAGFYLLARVIEAIRLMAEQPVAAGPAHAWLARLVEAIAYLLPDLDRFTRGEWLAYPGLYWADLGAVAIQTGIYLALLTGVALFDLYRRNL